MASTDVDICNGALIKVGEETITALSDDNKRARACNERYADLRDNVLTAHPWNFAIKRQQLVDETLIKNGRFTTGIQHWTDSSESTSSIAWGSTYQTLELTAIYNAAARQALASQAFTLTETKTLTLTVNMERTDAADETTDNYIGIGTSATNVDQGQTYFSSLNDDTEAELEVTLTAGTYYVTIGTYCSVVAATYVTEFDNITLTDNSGINDNFVFNNQFALPSDMLRIMDTDMDDEEFAMEGDYLVTDTNEIAIRYIAQITDVTKFSQLFTEALMARIAADLAVHLVDSDSRLQQMEALYTLRMKQARFVDSQQGTPEELPNGRWLGSRYGIVAK